VPSEFLKSIIANWVENKNTTLAAAIAFYTLFSFSPILIITMNIVGLFVQRSFAEQEIFNLLSEWVSPRAASLVGGILESGVANNFYASIISFVLLVYASTFVFTELNLAFDNILGVKKKANKKEKFIDFMKTKAKVFFLVPCTSFVFMLTLFSEFMLNKFGETFNDVLGLEITTLGYFNDWISYLLIFLMIAGLLHFLPSKNLKFVPLFAGSFVSSFFFIIGKNLLAIYLSSALVTSFYGKAGSLVVLILWVYYSVQMLLLGAEVSNYFERKTT